MVTHNHHTAAIVARIVLVALASIPIGYLLEWIMGIGLGDSPRPPSEGTVIGE